MVEVIDGKLFVLGNNLRVGHVIERLDARYREAISHVKRLESVEEVRYTLEQTKVVIDFMSTNKDSIMVDLVNGSFMSIYGNSISNYNLNYGLENNRKVLYDAISKAASGLYDQSEPITKEIKEDSNFGRELLLLAVKMNMMAIIDGVFKITENYLSKSLSNPAAIYSVEHDYDKILDKKKDELVEIKRTLKCHVVDALIEPEDNLNVNYVARYFELFYGIIHKTLLYPVFNTKIREEYYHLNDFSKIPEDMYLAHSYIVSMDHVLGSNRFFDRTFGYINKNDKNVTVGKECQK